MNDKPPPPFFLFEIFHYKLNVFSFANSKWHINLAHPSSTYALLMYNIPKDSTNLPAKFADPALQPGTERLICDW
jgi:hypothetical protein